MLNESNELQKYPNCIHYILFIPVLENAKWTIRLPKNGVGRISRDKCMRKLQGKGNSLDLDCSGSSMGIHLSKPLQIRNSE